MRVPDGDPIDVTKISDGGVLIQSFGGASRDLPPLRAARVQPTVPQDAVRLHRGARPMHTMIEAVLTWHEGIPSGHLRVETRALRGGLEAASIEQITARYRDSRSRERVFRLVVKRLVGAAMREAAIYEQVVARHAADLAPRIFHVQHLGHRRAAIYMEALRPANSWPWRERHAAQRVLECVASLHTRTVGPEAMAGLPEWDYEAELQRTAALTLERLERLHRRPALWSYRDALRRTRRLVDALPALRRELLAHAVLGRAIVHGDLHSGNVVLRRRRGRLEPVLLDWARARVGSPLEDVSSWLQSLGAWEPEARRRHDTLFASYLIARGMEPRLDVGTRAAYWLAGASNALAGALLYHLSMALDDQVSSARRASATALAGEWVRVLRRADFFWS